LASGNVSLLVISDSISYIRALDRAVVRALHHFCSCCDIQLSAHFARSGMDGHGRLASLIGYLHVSPATVNKETNCLPMLRVLPEGSRSCHKLVPILKSSSSYVSRDPVHVRSFLRRTLQQNHEKSNSSSNVHTIYIHALVPLVLRCVLYISIKSQRVHAATRKAPNSQALSPLKFVLHDLVLLRIF
jgi:hypothetical protein